MVTMTLKEIIGDSKILTFIKTKLFQNLQTDDMGTESTGTY